MEFIYENVNQAFKGLVTGVEGGTIPVEKKESRAGNVMMIPTPVTVCYKNPVQRVLFNPQRDANPFFHLYESLWMLAGRNDVAPLAYYNSKIGDIASDDGKTFNGAYGYRWRNKRTVASINQTEGVGRGYKCNLWDQLDILIDHLRHNPDSRRAVLQMWDVGDDLLKIGGKTERKDTQNGSRDVCCNTAVYFSLREVGGSVLDMTVTNRDNDMIWGMLGANVVHFSFLQEYIANCLGVGVGRYYQFTNNLHVYEDNWHPKLWLSVYENRNNFSPIVNYTDRMRTHIPLVKDKEMFDKEVKQFVDENYGQNVEHPKWQEPFLRNVAQPLCYAFFHHKKRDYPTALKHCEWIEMEDWRQACTEWIKLRRNKWTMKNQTL